MDALTARQRVRQLRKRVKENNLDVLIISKTENVRYLTGFTGHDSWVLLTSRGLILITDSRYTEQARGECPSDSLRIVQRKGAMLKTVAAELARNKGIQRIGLEETVTVAMLKQVRKAMRKQKLSVTTVKNLVENLRSMKNDAEIDSIEQATRVAWQSLRVLLDALQTGMTEEQAAAVLEYEMRMRGAKTGFDTIIAFGPNGSRNHHQPGKRKLRKKDQVLIDFGARVDGYTCDITRSLSWGEPTGLYQKVWQTVYAAQQAAIAMMQDGMKVAAVDRAARKVIEDAGMEVYGHGTGHGLGLEVHEAPWISGVDKKGTLRAGQVVTIEPGIYLPGKFGVRIEDDVLVTKTGAKILSYDKHYNFSSDELIVL